MGVDCGIYLICCLPTQKVYVGSSQDISYRWEAHRYDLKQGKHHNSYLQRAWNKYGPDAFTWKVVEIISVGELLSAESRWFEKTRCCEDLYGFNIAMDPSAPMLGRKHTSQAKYKISRVHRGKMHTEDHRRKISDAIRGTHLTEEHKRKISEAQKGKHHTEATRRKISEAQKGNTHSLGHIHTEATRKKISEANLGKHRASGFVHTEATKRKISEAHKGKHLSEETRRKISESQKVRLSFRKSRNS